MHDTNQRVIYIFFFNDTATTEIYTLSLHDALPIYERANWCPASDDDAKKGSCLLHAIQQFPKGKCMILATVLNLFECIQNDDVGPRTKASFDQPHHVRNYTYYAIVILSRIIVFLSFSRSH